MQTGMSVRSLALVVPARDSDTTIPVGVSLIPQFQAREAARFVGLPWRDYCALPPHERIDAVAHYWAARLYETHVADATATEQERRAITDRQRRASHGA